MHGALVGSMFSAVFASHFPNCIYMSQTYKFVAPVALDESVTARVEVTGVDRKQVTCSTVIRNTKTGAPVIEGTAKVMIPTLTPAPAVSTA